MASRFVTTAERGDQRRPDRDEQEQEAERRARRRSASGVFWRSACARSWFSAAWPPTRAPGGRAARSRSIVRPTAGLDGSALGHRLHEGEAAGPGLRMRARGRCRDRAGRRPRRQQPDLAAWRSGALPARRRRRPAGSARSRSREPSPLGTTLIDGMPVFSPRTGRASRTSTSAAAGAEHVRVAPESFAPARRARASGAPRSAPSEAVAR